MEPFERYNTLCQQFSQQLYEACNGDIDKACNLLQNMIDMGRDNPDAINIITDPKNIAMAKTFMGIGGGIGGKLKLGLKKII